MKWVLSILCVLLFLTAFLICKLVYPEAFLDVTDPNFKQEFVDKFTDLRYNLYAVFGLLCFLTLYTWIDNKKARFIFDIGIGCCAADILDRVFFDITTFQTSDIIMLFVTIVTAFFDYYKQQIYDRITRLNK